MEDTNRKKQNIDTGQDPKRLGQQFENIESKNFPTFLSGNSARSSRRPMSATQHNFRSEHLLAGKKNTQTIKGFQKEQALSPTAREDINFVFDDEDAQQIPEWKKLFYSSQQLSRTASTDTMFFKKRAKQTLGSRCPATQSQTGIKTVRPQTARQESARLSNPSLLGSSKKDNGTILLLKPKVPINSYKIHRTMFDVAKDEVLASSMLQEMSNIPSTFSYAELCKIGRTTNENELLRAMAKNDPNGIAAQALREINPFKHSLVKKKPAVKKPCHQTIREEDEDTSEIKLMYYDTNDPEVQRVNRMIIHEREEEDYIQDANNEQEEAFEKFELKKRIQKRACNSRQFESTQPDVCQAEGVPSNDVVPRPTTVPTGPNIRDLRGGERVRSSRMMEFQQAREQYYQRFKQIQTLQKKSFSIIGQSARICERHQAFPIIGSEKNQYFPQTSPGGNTNIFSQSYQKNRMIPASASKRIAGAFIENQKPAFSTRPMTAGPQLRHQQINIVTQEDALPNQCNSKDLPTKGDSKILSTNKEIEPIPERPFSANFDVHRLGTSMAYIPSNYMKSYGKHKKPISASVNANVAMFRPMERSVNPQRTKAQYMRYLQLLEQRAKGFVFEENPTLTSGEEQKQPQSAKPRKKVRMKKKSLTSVSSAPPPSFSLQLVSRPAGCVSVSGNKAVTFSGPQV